MPRRKHLPMSRKEIFIILMCSIIIISFRKVHTSVFWHWLPKAAPSNFFSHMSNIFTANFSKTEGKSSALKHFINCFYVKLRLKQFSPSLCVALGLPKILPILFEILTSSDMEDYVSEILRFLLKYHKMVEIRPKKWFFLAHFEFFVYTLLRPMIYTPRFFQVKDPNETYNCGKFHHWAIREKKQQGLGWGVQDI